LNKVKTVSPGWSWKLDQISKHKWLRGSLTGFPDEPSGSLHTLLENNVVYNAWNWHYKQVSLNRDKIWQWSLPVFFLMLPVVNNHLKNIKRRWTWMVKKATMHMQFPMKHKTPRWNWSNPRSSKQPINHPEALVFLWHLFHCFTKSVPEYPINAGSRYKTISTTPKTIEKVPPTLAKPSYLSKFTLSVLHEQVYQVHITLCTGVSWFN